MSTGIVICGDCKREVHQNGKWFHCEDGTPLCSGTSMRIYPKSTAEIQGKWCGADGTPSERRQATPTATVKPQTKLLTGKPVVKFTKGSFKSFRYDSNEGQIVRVK